MQYNLTPKLHAYVLFYYSMKRYLSFCDELLHFEHLINCPESKLLQVKQLLNTFLRQMSFISRINITTIKSF